MPWRYWLHTLFDTLMPERASAQAVRLAADDALLHFLAPREINGVITLLPYQEPLVRAAITEAKFYHNTRAQRLLARVVAAHLSQYTPVIEVVIPIPLSRQRHRERGYNQVTAVLQLIPELPLESAALIKTRHTTAQTTLGRRERLRNLTGAFTLTRPERITNKVVYLIDDVLTTGATLQAAAAAVHAGKPKQLTLLAFAH